MFTDLISVIVPVYNVEKYLSKCINSILDQTYKNLEIILVDDGSTDNSGIICDNYANKDNRIKVVHKDNGGLSDARNKGIKASNGKYIVFVDSDDYIKNTMIDTMYNRIITQDSDMAICRFVHVNEKGDVINTFSGSAPYEDMIMSSENMLRYFSCNYVIFYAVACCKLYKRYLWEDVRFPVGKTHEDEFVAHHIMGKCKQISIIAEPCYYYVQHSGSITNSGISVKSMDAIEAFLDRTVYYFRNKLDLEATRLFSLSISNYNSRSNKLNNNEHVECRKKELMKIIRRIYANNIYKFLKHCSLKSFIYLTLFVINPKLSEFVLKILKSTK